MMVENKLKITWVIFVMWFWLCDVVLSHHPDRNAKADIWLLIEGGSVEVTEDEINREQKDNGGDKG